MKIAIAGAGYVGLSNGILLAQHNHVVCLEVSQNKVEMLNLRESPLDDVEIKHFLKFKSLDFSATINKHEAYEGADFVVIATPTDYDQETNQFNTQSVDSVIKDVLTINPNAVMVIKSTIPLGYTLKTREAFGTQNLFYSPEFLREGKALYDNLYPSRIVVGERSGRAERFAELLTRGAIKEDVKTLFTESTEAEAIKLFSNSYLAMRVAFFNELDTYAAVHGLNTRHIVDGVCLDPRIGQQYNNPSFGYGGYCLPKDVKQLVANFQGVPQSLIQSTRDSNLIRKDFIASEAVRLAKSQPVRSGNRPVVGIYRLIMKAGSENYRESAVHHIIDNLMSNGIDVILYEPSLSEPFYFNLPVIQDLDDFKRRSQLILANRLSHEISDVPNKVYSRDIFGKDD